MARTEEQKKALLEAVTKELEKQGVSRRQAIEQAKEMLRLQDEVAKSATDFLSTLVRANEIYKDNNMILEQAAAAQREFYKISEEIGDVTKDTATYMGAVAEAHEAGLLAAQNLTSEVERHRDGLREKIKLIEEGKIQSDENLDALKEELEVTIETVAHYKQKVKETQILNAEIQKQAEGYKRIDASTQSFAQSLTGVTQSGFEDSVLGSIDAVGGLSNALTQVGESMSQTFTVANVLGSGITGIINETIRMVAMTDQAQSSFYKTTGATGNFNDAIVEVQQESAIMGVNIEDSGRAFGTLFTQMRGFSDLSKEAQVNLASFTAEMDQLGVDSGTTADLLDSATKSLNMTSEEGKSMVKEVSAAARALGVPVGQMNEDLKAALPTLAAYGKSGIKVFKGIAAQAKAAGLATGDLLGIVEQFDTFEGAAESVGRLNGILGGNYLNSLEMVNMTEDERVRTLIQTLEMTGRNFESLGKYERKAIAASIGIQDMDKANRLLGMSTAELDEKMSQADAGILSKEEMQAMADKARDFSAKLENLMQSMAVFLNPIISVINFVVEGFLKLNSLLGNKLAPVVLALGAAFLIGRLAMRSATQAAAADAAQRLLTLQTKAAEIAVTKGMTAAEAEATLARITGTGATNAETAATSRSTLARGFETIGKGASATASFLLAAAKYTLLAATIAIGAPLLILVGTMYALAAATLKAIGPWGLFAVVLLLVGVALMASLHSPPLYIGLGILVGLMIALAMAGTGATAPMMAFGVAMLKVGFAVALAGLGFLKASVGALIFGVAIMIMAAALVVAAVGLVIVVAAVLALAAGLAIIGMFAFLAAPGLIFFAASIFILIPALMMFALLSFFILPPLFALALIVAIIGTSMAAMFNAMAGGAGIMSTISSGLAGIEEAMSNISLFSVLKFLLLTEGFEEIAAVGSAGASSLHATADVINATATVDTSKVEAVEDLVSELGSLAITATIFPGLIFASAFMEGLTSAMGGGDQGGETGKGQDIYLVMDPSGVKTIAKAVDVQLNKRHNVLASKS